MTSGYTEIGTGSQKFLPRFQRPVGALPVSFTRPSLARASSSRQLRCRLPMTAKKAQSADRPVLSGFHVGNGMDAGFDSALELLPADPAFSMEIQMPNSNNALAPRAILLGLEPALESELAASLRSASFAVSHGPGSPVKRDGGLIFCPRGAAFAEARKAFPELPVVVVSRLPDTGEWLEALDLGAADYIAAPFEPVQMRWLWKAQHSERAAAAAA